MSSTGGADCVWTWGVSGAGIGANSSAAGNGSRSSESGSLVVRATSAARELLLPVLEVDVLAAGE
jgi:hypothetical protein